MSDNMGQTNNISIHTFSSWMIWKFMLTNEYDKKTTSFNENILEKHWNEN